MFPFKLCFLGFFSVCLPNIYFKTLEYSSTLGLLSFDKMIYKHFATQRHTAFLAPPLLQWLNEETCLYEQFCWWAPENNCNWGLAYFIYMYWVAYLFVWLNYSLILFKRSDEQQAIISLGNDLEPIRWRTITCIRFWPPQRGIELFANSDSGTYK